MPTIQARSRAKRFVLHIFQLIHSDATPAIGGRIARGVSNVPVPKAGVINQGSVPDSGPKPLQIAQTALDGLPRSAFRVSSYVGIHWCSIPTNPFEGLFVIGHAAPPLVKTGLVSIFNTFLQSIRNLEDISLKTKTLIIMWTSLNPLPQFIFGMLSSIRRTFNLLVSDSFMQSRQQVTQCSFLKGGNKPSLRAFRNLFWFDLNLKRLTRRSVAGGILASASGSI